ncbi:MAG TPA: hypothetical protein PK360_00060 [bacterium]|nr:hypothetical protein [bacterium]
MSKKSKAMADQIRNLQDQIRELQEKITILEIKHGQPAAPWPQPFTRPDSTGGPLPYEPWDAPKIWCGGPSNIRAIWAGGEA